MGKFHTNLLLVPLLKNAFSSSYILWGKKFQIHLKELFWLGELLEFHSVPAICVSDPGIQGGSSYLLKKVPIFGPYSFSSKERKVPVPQKK